MRTPSRRKQMSIFALLLAASALACGGTSAGDSDYSDDALSGSVTGGAKSLEAEYAKAKREDFKPNDNPHLAYVTKLARSECPPDHLGCLDGTLYTWDVHGDIYLVLDVENKATGAYGVRIFRDMSTYRLLLIGKGVGSGPITWSEVNVQDWPIDSGNGI